MQQQWDIQQLEPQAQMDSVSSNGPVRHRALTPVAPIYPSGRAVGNLPSDPESGRHSDLHGRRDKLGQVIHHAVQPTPQPGEANR